MWRTTTAWQTVHGHKLPTTINAIWVFLTPCSLHSTHFKSTQTEIVVILSESCRTWRMLSLRTTHTACRHCGKTSNSMFSVCLLVRMTVYDSSLKTSTVNRPAAHGDIIILILLSRLKDHLKRHNTIQIISLSSLVFLQQTVQNPKKYYVGKFKARAKKKFLYLQVEWSNIFYKAC